MTKQLIFLAIGTIIVGVEIYFLCKNKKLTLLGVLTFLSLCLLGKSWVIIPIIMAVIHFIKWIVENEGCGITQKRKDGK